MPNPVGEERDRARALALVDFRGDCWEWMGRKHVDGYGQGPFRGRGSAFAHRTIWTVLVGEIPAGLHIDHLCQNKICVNPDHLELVTAREHATRGHGWAAECSRRTHCPRGHSYEGCYITPSGHRRCLVCVKPRQAAWRARRREGVRVAVI